MPSLQGSPRRKSYLTGHESGTDFCSMFFLIQKSRAPLRQASASSEGRLTPGEPAGPHSAPVPIGRGVVCSRQLWFGALRSLPSPHQLQHFR